MDFIYILADWQEVNMEIVAEIILMIIYIHNMIKAVSYHIRENYIEAIYHMTWVICTLLILSKCGG